MSGSLGSRFWKTASDAASSGIVIGGVQWTTLVDYPGKVAATLFTVGCNFRCPFCHNPELVDPARFAQALELGELLDRLRERAGFIDGVVISGGEPTIQPALPALAKSLKALGLLVKLDTNGSRPDVLRALLEEGHVDFIAMDIKAPLDRYDEFSGVSADTTEIEASIGLILDRAPDHEFRTTVAPSLSRVDVLRIAERLVGAKRFALQPFRVPEKGLLDPTWETKPALSKDELRTVWEEIRTRFADGGVRG